MLLQLLSLLRRTQGRLIARQSRALQVALFAWPSMLMRFCESIKQKP
jgi:hypothetical protein